MNAPNVRSATVRLNAEVAKYMADMKAAGRVTDEAFDRAQARATSFDRSVDGLSDSVRELGAETKTTSRETVGLGDALGKTTRRAREFNLQTAIAEERVTRLRAGLREQARAAIDAEQGIDRTTISIDRAGNAIDRASGRLGIYLKLAASVGPTLGPLGAVGIAGVAGLASQLGFAVAGITSLVVASQGVGDALKAIEKARLDPTVENIEKAREAMEQLGPHARDFVNRLTELRPVFREIRDQAAAGWFPGLIEALDYVEQIAPKIGRIFESIGRAGGDLLADGAQALSGPEWGEFLAFVEREAPAALEDLGRTAGNLVSGLAKLWMAFSPVNNDFSDWLLEMSRRFDDWAGNLSKTKGFQEFVRYIRTNGPKVADAVVAIADAIIQIVEAAAPLGGPVLEMITGLANALAAIADSPIGTPLMVTVGAISALSLASSVAAISVGRLSTALGTLGATKAGASVAGLASGGPLGLMLAGITTSLANVGTQFEAMEDGAQGLGETLLKSFVPGLREAAAIHELFKEADQPFLEAAAPAGDLALGTDRVSTAADRAADAQLRAAERANRVREAMAAQQEEVSQAAAAWSDFSQKVELGDTSVEDLIRRWEKLATASTNMADNIQEALERGLDPNILKGVIDQLGPQGAALALEEFANATGARAKQIERNFRSMVRGTDNFSDSYELLASLISGTPLSIGNDLIFELDAAKAAFDRLPKDVRTEIRAEGIPQTKAQIDSLVAKYKLTEKEREALVTLADQASPKIQGILGLLARVKDKHVTVTTTFIRETINRNSSIPQSPPGGGNPLTDPVNPRTTVPRTSVPASPSRDTGAFVGKASVSTYTKSPGDLQVGIGDAMTVFATGVSNAALFIDRFADATDRATQAARAQLKVEIKREERHNAALERRIQLLEAERDAIESSIESRLQSIGDAGERTYQDYLEDGWATGLTAEEQAEQIAFAQELADIYNQANSPNNILQGNINQLEQLNAIINRLEAMGLDEDALSYALQNLSTTQLGALANGSQSAVDQFEEFFEQQQHLLEETQGNAVEAAGVNRKLHVTNRALRESNRHLRQMQKDLEEIKKNTRDNADASARGADESKRGADNAGKQGAEFAAGLRGELADYDAGRY